jgi:hypothetical protein
MKGKTVFLCLMGAFLILTSSADALLVRGTDLSIVLDFEPGKVMRHSYRISPTPGITGYDFITSTPPELEGMFSFDPPNLRGVVSEASFEVTITLPEILETPGMHVASFRVAEAVEESGGIVARAAIKIPVGVRVLYPGKYAMAELDAKDASEGKPVDFEVTVENWGESAIDRTAATIYVFDSEGRSIGTLATDEKPVAPADSARLSATLDDTSLKPGEYSAHALVSWDGKQSEANATFRIGTADIDVLEYNQTFVQDSINLMEIKVLSRWNNRLSNVYATVTIDADRRIEIKTPGESLGPWESRTLGVYWDAAGLAAGEYDARLTVHFDGMTKTQDIMITALGGGTAVVVPKEGISQDWIILIAAIAIIAAGALAVFVLRPKKKPRRGRR